MIQQEKSTISPFAVFIDEAGSVLTQGSVDWLNKCRSAGFLACLGIQSLADLETVTSTFKTQVMANCNNLIIFRPNDHTGTEELAMTIGTKDTLKRTVALEPGIIFDDTVTGYSLREVKEFHISPDTIKELPDGRAAVLIRGNQTIRGIWNLSRIYSGNGSFDQWLPRHQAPVLNKKGLDWQTAEEEKAPARTTAARSKISAHADPLLAKPELVK